MSCAVKRNALPVLKTGDVCMNNISQLPHLIGNASFAKPAKNANTGNSQSD
jgi:hypothetical protein